MKFILGTAQFGLDYGVSNTGGIVTDSELADILACAQQNDITMLDTAVVYGNSEERLGKQLSQNCPFKYITKIPSQILADEIVDCVRGSLARLNCHSLYAVMCHDADDLRLSRGDQFFSQLTTLKSLGMTKKLGVSVYTPEHAIELVENYPIDIIQLPFNVYDQRFLTSGCLDYLKEKGVETHIRSIFLQGLLLMELAEIPSYFKPMFQHIHNYYMTLDKLSISKYEAALNFIKTNKYIDYAVIGVQSMKQLKQFYDTWNHLTIDALPYSSFSMNIDKYILPSKWII